MRAKQLFLLLMTGASTIAHAQLRTAGKDTVMKGATIEVIQAYKPKVKQTPKPEWIPQLAPLDTTHRGVSYDDVPQQSLYYTYTSMPLHPLALGKDDQKLPFPNYVKLGGGNLNTIYLDAGIGSLSGKDYETAIHLHHLSQKGSIVNQQSAMSGIEAEGFLHKSSADLHAALQYERNQFSYYGYRHDLYKYNADTVKQVFNKIGINLDLKNPADTNTAFSWHPALSGSLYTAKIKTTETNFGFDLPLAYKIEKNLFAHLALSGALTNLKVDSVSTNNNFIRVDGGFSLQNKSFNGHSLVGFAIGKDSKKYLLPDIYAAYSIKPKLALFAGVKTTLRQNTFEQLTTDNPYIYTSYIVRQSTRAEYFAGVQGAHQDHLTYSARLSYWNYAYLPAFDNSLADQKQFIVGYYNQDVKAISLQLTLRYSITNKWSTGFSADIYRFDNGTTNYVLGEPSTRIKADFRISATPKLSFSAYLNIMAGIHAMDNLHHYVQLNAFADLGGSAEYIIIPRLSVFAQINNLLNDRYQRWYGYEAYGINIYGGLRLKF